MMLASGVWKTVKGVALVPYCVVLALTEMIRDLVEYDGE